MNKKVSEKKPSEVKPDPTRRLSDNKSGLEAILLLSGKF